LRTITRTAESDKPHFAISRHVSPRGGFLFHASRFFELARVLVRFDHVARIIVERESQHHSFRFVSLNGITRSTLPLASRM